jgi:hypothetical protein
MIVASKYTVIFLKGDYRARQAAAGKAKCNVYYEQHFNSSGPSATYGCVLVANNASAKSRQLAATIGSKSSLVIGNKNNGVVTLHPGDRGYGNIAYTAMPACLGESGFVSNPGFARWIKVVENQKALGRVVADSIKACFPDGAKIGFSVGHKYKTSNPDDRGANVSGGGSEATYAEAVLLYAKNYLEVNTDPIVVPTPVPTPTPKPTPVPTRPVLRHGSKGEAVKVVQRRLASLNCYTGRIDGDFGPLTEFAVKKLQKRKGLYADGIVGPKTYKALGM